MLKYENKTQPAPTDVPFLAWVKDDLDLREICHPARLPGKHN